MKNVRRSHLLLGAVAMALATVGRPSSAHAQYRINDDGHLNDANNRIGSGGYNGGRSNSQFGTASNILNTEATNNQIISGNVTGLKYFHGPAAQDPNEFAASTGTTQTDRFLAISGPQDITARSTGAPTVTPFYSTDRLATPVPPGLVATSTGAAIPTNDINKNTNSNNLNDTRLGILNNNSINYIPLPAPGELDLPGPVDPSGNPSSLIASPLYGMRQWSASDSSDAYFMSRYTNVQPNSPLAQAATNAQIQQMRNELNNTMVQNGQADQGDSTANGNNKLGTSNNLAANAGIGSTPGAGIVPANANLNQSQQLNSSSGALASGAVSNQPLNSNLSNQQGNANFTPGTRQQLLVMVPPEQQSAQLKDLQQRLASNRQRLSPEQAAQVFNEENRLNNQAKTDAANKTTGTAGTPPTTPTAGQAPDISPGGMLGTGAAGTLKPRNDKTEAPPLNPMLTAPTAGNDKPYVITSLATGVKAKGLADLLKTAETQMRDGKFSSALDTYDMARQVAPNNPFATLGRAFAELGAASYGRSEQDLRQAFSVESGEVLLGQYDLRGFLGEDRLKFVVKDLKEINSRENNERSAFLLSYIAHNVGDDENAAKLLNDAEKRAGGNDPIIDLMRDSWQLKK